VSDDIYSKAGANVHADLRGVLAEADLVLGLNKPSLDVVEALRPGTVTASLLDPFRSPDLVRALAAHDISAIAMELIPRSTYAQKMDALSSQASLAGYAAVIAAAHEIGKVLPMMTTPAGTIPPARVFVIGVGVAGLQAIATAKRLGARVEAYDTRPAVAEQVQSLGAKFVQIDVGETGQTEQGYAKPLTEEQLESQRKQMARFCANSDIVITTAQLFGRPAPRIVTADMVAGMRPGSVIVDLAASTGGNVEGSRPDETVEVAGVRIVGLVNLPGEVARDASQMYASNLWNLIEHAWDAEAGALAIDVEDDVIGSCLLTHAGEVRDERVRATLEETA
jgi:NAD(P) transhydrogenase subunit alpha